LTTQETKLQHQDIPNLTPWEQWFEFQVVCDPIQIQVPEIAVRCPVDKLPLKERLQENI